MTAFASEEAREPFGRLGWEIRSVNHRYQEISLRLPEEFRALEAEFRDVIGRHISRGKVDATLRFHPSAAYTGASMGLNRELADSLLAIHSQLAEAHGLEQKPSLLTLMRWPGVIDESSADQAPVNAAALVLLQTSMEKLGRMRGREGDKIAGMLRQRLDGIEQWVGQTREWLPEIRAQLKTRLLERIDNLKQPLDEGRLEQEVAMQAQKMDIDEELDRLAVHVEETRRVLQLDEPVGRRLDFLMQEFNRESNTLGSKSIDSRTTQAGVELKVLVEQMREQIQNVE